MKSQDPNTLSILPSDNLSGWLAEQQLSLAFTTYQVGKVFMVGRQPDGTLHVSERTFPRCMGIALRDNTIWMSSIFQMWRFENSLKPGQTWQGYDRVYIPQMAYTTGDVDIHDIVVDTTGKPVFVNTQFNCLARASETHSFKPLWKPPFISGLVAEDRCHLNGLAAVDGQPRYVTLVGPSDTKDGWRAHRKDGGMVMDVTTNEVLCQGLSMPHSPRVHQGKVWVLEAGTGHLGYVDPARGGFEPVCFCPGFLRGMSFIGKYAIVGLSKNRETKTFGGLALDDELDKRGLSPQCGLDIIDLERGQVVASLRLEGLVRELYDVMAMPHIHKPLIIGTMKEDIQRMISIEP